MTLWRDGNVLLLGQTVGWIKIKLGVEIGLGHIVLDAIDWEPAPPKRGTAAPLPVLGLCILLKRLDGSRLHLVQR